MTRPVTGGPLLTTKFYLPTPRANAVTRARLASRLVAGLRTRLTLIAAPAGFGKSTLLAQVLGAARPLQESSSRIAWLALDAGDNDPVRFWTYLCGALEQVHPGAGTTSLALLRAAPSDLELVMADVLNGVVERAEEVVLVLDDYHVITNPAIHESITFFIEHAPPLLHLVIASRSDPPLPLARWRARNELVEIRATALRFTPEEAYTFLVETMGLSVDAPTAAALEARTEGWPAGLQLAALSLQGHPDVRGFLETFSGSHRHIVDYLAEEVLNQQPEPVRTFLLQTSVLERMCAELCHAVMGQGTQLSAAAILTEIEQQNLFLVPLDDDRRWYRYHHLFADLLRHRLAQEQATVVPELHRRAAHWFETRGEVADAVSHAIAAEDPALLVRVLTPHVARFVATGETQTLQHWLDALPRAIVFSTPQLCLAQAWVYLFNRQTAAMEPYLQAAETVLSSQDAVGWHGELLSLRAAVALERGVPTTAVTLARQALVLLPLSDRWTRSNTGLVLGLALSGLGYTTEAAAVHAEHVRLARAAGNAVSALFNATEVVKLQLLQGHLREARASAEHAIAWTADAGWQHLAPASALHIWLGTVLIEAGDLLEAERVLAHATRLTPRGPDITAARAQMFLARLRQLQSDWDGALAALARVEEICRDWEPEGSRVFFDAHIVRVRLLQGEMEDVHLWCNTRRPWTPEEVPAYFREIELLTLARVAVLDAPGSPAPVWLPEPFALLAWVREQALAGGRGAVVLETLALEALAFARAGRTAEAHHRLDEALEHAAPEGFIGLFLDLGVPMADLIAQTYRRRAQNDPLDAFRVHLLHAFDAILLVPGQQTAVPPRHDAGDGAFPLVEALTEREVEVLRLLAVGRSGPEIAEHFIVSINTVKTQIRSIYSKLDAHSRKEVLEKARLLRLLP